jgi:hypothetical protein
MARLGCGDGEEVVGGQEGWHVGMYGAVRCGMDDGGGLAQREMGDKRGEGRGVQRDNGRNQPQVGP